VTTAAAINVTSDLASYLGQCDALATSGEAYHVWRYVVAYGVLLYKLALAAMSGVLA